MSGCRDWCALNVSLCLDPNVAAPLFSNDPFALGGTFQRLAIKLERSQCSRMTPIVIFPSETYLAYQGHRPDAISPGYSLEET